MPNQCFLCRKNNKVVPCERDKDKICGFTSAPAVHIPEPGDKGNPHEMKMGKTISLISQMWMDIVLMSRKENIKKQVDKETQIEFKLFTLEHIDAYLNRQEWEHISVTEKEAFDLIILFHRIFVSTSFSKRG